jgi:tRNA (5-methylaminomethyl-2-thiouridylate)-methyltransferase
MKSLSRRKRCGRALLIALWGGTTCQRLQCADGLISFQVGRNVKTGHAQHLSFPKVSSFISAAAPGGDSDSDDVHSHSNRILAERFATMKEKLYNLQLPGDPPTSTSTPPITSSTVATQQAPLYVDLTLANQHHFSSENENRQKGLNLNMNIVRMGQLLASSIQATQKDTSSISLNCEGEVKGSGSLQSPRKQVPGCIATVHLSTCLELLEPTLSGGEYSMDDDDQLLTSVPVADASTTAARRYTVRINGDADAMLSRGLVAILATSLGDSGDSTSSMFYNGNDNNNKDNNSRPDNKIDTITAADVLTVDADTVADQLGVRETLSRGRNDGLANMVRVIQNQIRELLSDGDDTLPKELESSDMDMLESGEDDSGSDKIKVAMLLSGGVDSSVALHLLARDPKYEVHAYYLKIWLEDEMSHLGQCPWEDDWKMCEQVVQSLQESTGINVPLRAIGLQKEYRDQIIQYTLEEAVKGRTPNPDIMCNARVKFGCFYDAIANRKYDFIATGHYADVRRLDVDVAAQDDGNIAVGEGNGRTTTLTTLHRAPDPIKDQSYFLSALSQEQLSRVLFPLGKFHKSHVRELAENFELPNKKRPDSQGLCFLGKIKFDDFLGAYLGEKPGQITDAATGEVIGRHKGLWYHTVGQRKGIGNFLDPKVTARGPWYIVAKDPKKNLVIASNQYDDESFISARSEFFVEDLRWVSGEQLPTNIFDQNGETKQLTARFGMKIRHGPTIRRGTMTMIDSDCDDCGSTTSTGTTATGNGNGSNTYEGFIRLDTKDGGLAPGQFVAFYNVEGDECLGSGVISERHWAPFFSASASSGVEGETSPNATTQELVDSLAE